MKLKPLLVLALAATLAACAATPPAGKPGAVGPGKKDAPLQVGPDIIAEVPLADAWSLISDVDHWSDWNSRLTGVTHTAALAEGATFIYKDGGKEVDATVVTLKDQEQLAWEGALTGSHAHLHWTLKAMDAQRTLVSLRAELKPTASSDTVGAAGTETSNWVAAVQVALAKKSDALKAAAAAAAPAPAPHKKKRHAAAVPTPAATAPAQ
jgi:hypothetical protein